MAGQEVTGKGAAAWPRERIAQLSRQEVLHLQANAVRLGEAALAEICAAVLKTLPTRGPSSSGASVPRKAGLKLIPRTRAFQARGVFLQDPRSSWSGVRRSDGAVVFALWSQAIESKDGGCSYLLWSPNKDGSRPWYESAAGTERREHCVAAVAKGLAEGLLVHGEAFTDRLPEERARTVLGIDPETVIALRVEKRGAEFWAIWGN
jgi:hypothetical protein